MINMLNDISAAQTISFLLSPAATHFLEQI